ncbi:MAG: hypothetical protein HS111_05460 [Kofleriaceae bacterium]|nr:hypothetical protein [Kofleriaceae bacterium]
MRGDWLDRYDVLWTHLHDSYQTPVTVLVANLAPTWSWGGLQVATLVFETGAPLLLAAPWTRGPALAYGLAMHAMIGLMFGPVVWFSLLMMIWLAASFAPPRWLEVALRLARRRGPHRASGEAAPRGRVLASRAWGER